MKTNRELTYLRVWEMTIGRGYMPEDADEIIAVLNTRLVPHLTPAEEDVVREAHRRCYQEFHQP